MIDKLIERIKELNNPTVVGLDPKLDFVPEFIKKEAYDKYGMTTKGAAEAFLKFNKMIIDEIYTLVPAVKPQVSMYEQLGEEGIRVYIETIKYAKEKGLIVIGDIKRGDIASTAEAYSNGHIGMVQIGDENHKVYESDFVTVNPYMGYDAVSPYLNNCEKYDKGLFVLVKTSNPFGGQIQDIESKDGEKIYEKVGNLVSEWGKDHIGESGFSKIGAVVGATYPEQGKRLRELMPHTFFLVPGYGAQGATAKDLVGCFNKEGIGAIVNSSRGIIAAYKKDEYKVKFTDKEFAKAARAAVIDMKKDLTTALESRRGE